MSASRGDRRREITYADISWKITNTKVVPIKNSVVMNVWDDMKQFESRGELHVEVWDKFMYVEENTMGDVWENYMVAETCPTGGPKNILRYAGTIAGDDVPVLADEGGGMAKAVDGRGDVRLPVPVDAGAARVQVPVDAGGGAGQAKSRLERELQWPQVMRSKSQLIR